jgi:hypothetical protein
MWTDQPQTIQQSYKDICEGENPWLPLGNFMNDFFSNFADRRMDLVHDPIQGPEQPTVEQQQWAVFCAAAVEYLCEKYDLSAPAWIREPAYVSLAEPWFFSPAASNKPRVRERLERETPEAFVRRNIYCGNRVFLDKREEAAKLERLLSA